MGISLPASKYAYMAKENSAMFIHGVFASKALKGGWYVLGPIFGLLVLLANFANEATDLIIVIALLFTVTVTLIIWVIQDKQIDRARKEASYRAWDSLRRRELSEQIRKIVKDYKEDGKYYDAQLKRFFRLVRYTIAHAGAAGFSAEAIENDIAGLVEHIEDNLMFNTILDPTYPENRTHLITVVVCDGGEFNIILAGRLYDPED